MVELGNKIRELRRSRGLSLQGLADRMSVSVSRQHLSKIETGTIKLSEFWMREIARALDVSDPAALLADRTGDLHQSEVVYRAPPPTDTDPEVIKSILYPGRPNAFWMQVSASSLNLAGLQIGDFLIVDPDIAPVEGDIIVVQCYDEARADADTRILEYHPPVMSPRSTDSGYRAVLVSDPQARVVGTIVCRYARRKLSIKQR